MRNHLLGLCGLNVADPRHHVNCQALHQYHPCFRKPGRPFSQQTEFCSPEATHGVGNRQATRGQESLLAVVTRRGVEGGRGRRRPEEASGEEL